MFSEAYAIAVAIYPMLLISTLVVGGIGIVMNRGGSRRVGAVMIGCQLALLGLWAIGVRPQSPEIGMVVCNGLSAAVLLLTPPTPPYRLQRLASSLFLASALLNSVFAIFDPTPYLTAMRWFGSAAIDMVMIMMLGGFCGGLVGKALAHRFRDHARGTSHSGHHR